MCVRRVLDLFGVLLYVRCVLGLLCVCGVGANFALLVLELCHVCDGCVL